MESVVKKCKDVVQYTDELKTELDRRIEVYKNGSEKPVAPVESKKRIQKLLKSSRK